MPPSIEIVWFKRDLRIVDHEPLYRACQRAQQNNSLILPIYIIEPEIWQDETTSKRHWQFIYHSLIELNQALTELGQPLQVVQGSAVKVFKKLFYTFNVQQLHSHQETGNATSFKRDLLVKKLCQIKQTAWLEIPQQAVKRGRLNRDFYSLISKKHFNSQPLAAPDYSQSQPIFLNNAIHEPHKWEINPYLPLLENLNFYASEQTQKGGRSQGAQLLQSFIEHRHRKYLANISKPLGGDLFSSRLSAHLAYGTFSTREVMFYSAKAARQSSSQYASTSPTFDDTELELQEQPSSFQPQRGLLVFQQRLFWQSHFMQKLETEPEIEFTAMHPAYRDIRIWDEQAKHYYQKWSQGITGFPMVDACMRCLQHTGWLPFRMRALLVSFASYQLWIPWQKTAQHLARLFTDFEPGIHYSQVQMQSGVTGINAIRIYNPIKQSQEHDANGAFIRKWCPELKTLDNFHIHTPWERDLINNNTVINYPDPIIDLEQATQLAKDKIYAIKKQTENKSLSQAVFTKHGSRNSPERRKANTRYNTKKTTKKSNKKAQAFDEKQLSLF